MRHVCAMAHFVAHPWHGGQISAQVPGMRHGAFTAHFRYVGMNAPNSKIQNQTDVKL